MSNKNDQEREFLIPQSFHRVKGKISFFTWTDLCIILPALLIIALPMVTGSIDINKIPSLAGYIALIVGISLITLFLCWPNPGSDKKNYISIIVKIRFLLSHKVYGTPANPIKNAFPFDSVKGNVMASSTTGNKAIVIAVKGVDIEIFDDGVQSSQISSFNNLFNQTTSPINIIKFNKRQDYLTYENELLDILEKEIEIFLHEQRKLIPDYDELLTKIADGETTVMDVYEAHKPKLNPLFVKQFDARLDNMEINIANMKSLTEDELYEPTYYLLFQNKDEKKLARDIELAMDILEGLGHEPKELSTKELISFINSYYQRNNMLASSSSEDFLDALPSKIEFKANHFISSFKQVDENGETKTKKQFSKVFYFQGYPSLVRRGWLSHLLNSLDVPVIIKTREYSGEEAQSIVKRKMRVANDNLVVAKDEASRIWAAREKAQLEALYSDLIEGATLQEFNLFITFSADSEKELKNNSTALIKKIKSLGGFRVNKMINLQKEGYIGMLPSLNDKFSSKNYQTIPTYVVAEGYPLTTDKFQDPAAPIIAKTYEQSPVMIDFTVANHNRTNHNIVVFGKSGSGKSFLSKKITKDLLSQGYRTSIIDPEDEFSGLVKNFAGKPIDMGGEMKNIINPLQFFSTLQDSDQDSVQFEQHISYVSAFLQSAAELTDQEESELPKLLNELYESFKINSGNAGSIPNDKWPIISDLVKLLHKRAQEATMAFHKNPATGWNYESLKGAYMKLEKISSSKNLKNILWNHPTTIDVSDSIISSFVLKSLLQEEDQSIVRTQMLIIFRMIMKMMSENKDKYFRPIETKDYEIITSSAELTKLTKEKETHRYDLGILNDKLSEDLKAPEKKALNTKISHLEGLMKVLDVKIQELEAKIAEDKTERAKLKSIWDRKWFVVLIDEAHLLFDSQNRKAVKLIAEMIKRMRKYHGISIIISQNINDFVGDKEILKYTSAILNNSQYKFVFKLEGNDIVALQQLLQASGGLSDGETDIIRQAPRGTSLAFLSSHTRLIIKTYVTEEEIKMMGDANAQI